MKNFHQVVYSFLPFVMLTAASCATDPATKSDGATIKPDLMLNANLLCIVAKEAELVSRELELAIADHQRSGKNPLDSRGKFASDFQRLSLEISALHKRIAEEVTRLNNTLSDADGAL